MNLRVVVPPVPLLTAADLAEHLRIADDDLQFALIDDYIAAAAEFIETQTGHVFGLTQYALTLDRWPYVDAPGYGTYPTNAAIVLPRSPLVSVDSLQYLDTEGALQTHTGHIVDTFARPARVLPPRFLYWPLSDVVSPSAVRLTFTAGYAVPALIPARARQALRFLVAHWHETRTPVSEVAMVEVPKTLQSLIRSLKI